MRVHSCEQRVGNARGVYAWFTAVNFRPAAPGNQKTGWKTILYAITTRLYDSGLPRCRQKAMEQRRSLA